MLSETDAVDQARLLKQFHTSERLQLDTIRRYWMGVQPLPAVIPSAAPREVRTMARIARVNACRIVVESLAQSLFVDNFRTANSDEDDAVWEVWQANKMDARQSGLHRAAHAFGASYAIVLPGDPVPVIRAASPRHLTAVYGDDPDWPEYALEYMGTRGWRLYDDTAIYFLKGTGGAREFTLEDTKEHNAGVTPIVRFLDEYDLDADDDVTVDARAFMNYQRKPFRGQVGPLMPLQDQIDLTTFSLLVAQWFNGFKQRWIIGWTAKDEAQQAKAIGSQLMTFDAPAEGEDSIKLGEFSQTDMADFIEAREATLRHAATLSQTPVHELTGTLVNLSADAIAAAENGHERKVDERKTLLCEAHEQMLRLAGDLGGFDVPDDAEVVWRDTSAHAFAAIVDGLGKLATMLNIPPQELWERIPGVTKQDIDRWKVAAQSADSLGMLKQIIDRQATPPVPQPAPAPVPAPAPMA